MSDTTANDLAPMPARTLAPAPAGGTPLRGVVQGARNLLSQPAVVKSLPLLGFIALAGLAAIIWVALSAPPSRTLFSGLPDEEKAAVVEALNTAGIANGIDNGTGAVTVGEDDYHRARMLLASQSLPRGGQQGSEVISNMPLGASRAVETERIRSARELDLARTIEGIDVVQSARVHLAVEQPSVFVREQRQPGASVMLTLAPGRTLSDAQVQAIVHLVGSSVPGLSPDDVSVVDQNGRLLSRRGGESAVAERQLATQTAIEDRYRQAIVTMLTPIVGADNFTTEVHAEMDFSEVQSTREGFPENARALASEEGQLSTDAAGGAGAPGGVPGALSNEPPPATQVAAAPGGAVTPAAAEAEGATAAGGRRTENYQRNFAVGREVSVTRQQSGVVKRITVAVALRNPEGARPRSQQELQQLEALVKGAVGFDQNRGDVVALSARAFASAEETPVTWTETAEGLWASPLARNLTAILIALIVVFGLGRPMMKKATTALAQRAETSRAARSQVGGEIASVLADRARSDLEMKVSLEMIEATRDYEQRAALIRSFVRQDPARAALVVRDLIRADAKDGAQNG
ncbi:flagellar basal-body MS-ring/collar protein FliF [Sphingosinicella sp. LHD-64]|uniref:flagellar basal-body MS-ring/collar protein FliF n=1 Tax=Sphingosinicella sp. LHD-64 TaxID=3072139 RepID=UPI00280EE758|nr:flagellar basal-body MS-ring/collar protein FliF [Sphingosinicella sp. LHD-64]MDQ8757168.1 flagellar basal-body MS-ring/collar protein FliF [Sphingosinicella sp. LHD-64]